MNKMLRYSFLTLLVSVFVTAQVAIAQVYTWTDDEGTVHFTDKPPKELQAKPEVVNIKPKKNIATTKLPTIAQLQPIRNSTAAATKSVLLEHLSIEYAGNPETENSLGKRYKFTREAGKKVSRMHQNDKALPAALPCLPVGDLNLNNAKYIIKQGDFRKPFGEVFEENGYRVTGDKTFAMQQSSRNDLSLAAVVTNMQLTHCAREGVSNLRNFTQNSTYLKIEWTVFDNLARRVVLKTTSEGIDDHFREPPRYNGAATSVERAFHQATEHLLAQQDFVDILVADLTFDVGYSDDGKDIKDMNIVQGNPNTRFISKTGDIEKASVTVRTASGHGSGFVISAPGYVLTNQHVVGQNREVIVIMNGKEQRAAVIRSHPGRDVALLKLEKRFSAEPMHINVNKVALGEEIYVVGTPLDERLDFSISRGIVSARRVMDERSYYQTDAAVNPGNSGGPVFNDSGNVIGITVAGMFTNDGGSKNINYVIPILDALAALKIDVN